MAIRILNDKSDGGGVQDDRDEIVAEITHGYGQVPNYTALDGVAVRSDDPEVIEAIVAAFDVAESAEFDGKSPSTLFFQKGSSFLLWLISCVLSLRFVTVTLRRFVRVMAIRSLTVRLVSALSSGSWEVQNGARQ